MSHRMTRKASERKGTVLALTVLSLIVYFAFVAFAVDFGYIVNARAELQRAADSSAMAACWEYAHQISLPNAASASGSQTAGMTAANTIAASNDICGSATDLDSCDVSWGYLADFSDRQTPLNTSNPSYCNAVQVLVRRANSINGQIPTFFGKVFGINGINSQATAIAGIVRDINGFAVPSDGSNLGFLPIALDLDTWNDMLSGIGSDNYAFNKTDSLVEGGSDGYTEANLYPERKGGAPGNRGTVDIGSSGNSTQDIKRQIRDGLSPSDLAHHGGKIEMDENGELILNGDTGISAGIKAELTAIIGETRVLPIFNKVQGPGNNADYTIVAFGGVRILDVKLTGSERSKYVMIQPAPVLVPSGVIAADEPSTSRYVYSPVILVR